VNGRRFLIRRLGITEKGTFFQIDKQPKVKVTNFPLFELFLILKLGLNREGKECRYLKVPDEKKTITLSSLQCRQYEKL
jgi:hypothetical protein